jgi:hypothetical protein
MGLIGKYPLIPRQAACRLSLRAPRDVWQTWLFTLLRQQCASTPSISVSIDGVSIISKDIFVKKRNCDWIV